MQFYKNQEKLLRTGSKKASPKTSLKILEMLKKSPETTIKDLATTLNISIRAVKYQIKTLQEKELIERIGSARGGHLEIIEK